MSTLHLLSLIITIPAILYSDYSGFKYFTGRSQLMSHKKMNLLHKLVFIGLFLLITTGVITLVPRWAIMFEKPFFYIKIAFVLTLLVNGLFIGKLLEKATTTPYTNLPKQDKVFLMTSGAISAVSWISVIIISFFFL